MVFFLLLFCPGTHYARALTCLLFIYARRNAKIRCPETRALLLQQQQADDAAESPELRFFHYPCRS